MQTFKCHICKSEYDSYLGLSRHSRITHQIDKDKLRIIIYNNGEQPLCKCGCGEEVSWNYKEEKFNDFRQGHYVRTTGGLYSQEGAKKSGETRKKKFQSGELTQWNVGISFEDSYGKDRASQMKRNISENKERSTKISRSLSGKKKSKEHIKKITEDRRKYWANDENRSAQRERRLIQFAENRVGKVVNNKLEQTFRSILDTHKIDYIQSFNSGRFVYDFYIPSRNILIEVDGDFYHSNPIKYPNGPIYETQIHNAKNDQIKNEWAKANGYTLLRFWESDIQDNRLQVVKTLIENLL